MSLAEYDQKRSLWLSKPATMIRKVALVQALREAYPGEFGGIYDGAEMPEPDLPAQVAEQVDAEAVEAVCEPEPDQQEQPPEEEAYEAEDIEF